MSKIVIRPRTGTNRFKAKQGISDLTVYSEFKDKQNKTHVELEGEYRGERLPGTGGTRRIFFDGRKRRWLLKKDNGEPVDQEWLDALVVKCNLRYPDDHYKRGEMITTADLTDPMDAFFNHDGLKYFQEEGVATFDSENPIHTILVAGERANRDVAPGGQNVYKAHERFVLYDTKTEDDLVSERFNKKAEAFRLFSSMGIEKKKDVVSALTNRAFLQEPNSPTLDKELAKYVDEDKRKTANGRTWLDEFLYVAGLDKERLKMKLKVQKAIREGVIVRSGGQYTFNGKPVGVKEEGVIDFFFRADNHHELDRLDLKLGIPEDK